MATGYGYDDEEEDVGEWAPQPIDPNVVQPMAPAFEGGPAVEPSSAVITSTATNKFQPSTTSAAPGADPWLAASGASPMAAQAMAEPSYEDYAPPDDGSGMTEYGLPQDFGLGGTQTPSTDEGGNFIPTTDASVQEFNQATQDWSAQNAAPAPEAAPPPAPAAPTLPDFEPLVSNLDLAKNPDDFLAAQDELARQVFDTLKNAGHDVEWNGTQLIVDGRPYEVGKQPPPDYQAMWAGATGPGYTPTPIGMDQADALPETLPQTGPTYTPTPIGAGAIDRPDWTEADLEARLGADPSGVTGDMDAFIRELLANPESLDPQTLAMLEAQMAEQEQEAFDAEDAAAERFGFAAGLQDSPWLAAERAGSARAHDTNIIKGRRDLAIEAARTNMGDRRAAAQIGAGYQSARTSQQHAQVMSTVQAGLQRYSQDLARLGEERARAALNASMEQEAAQLGISRDALSQQYTLQRFQLDLAQQGEDRARAALNASMDQEATRLGLARDQLSQQWAGQMLDDLRSRYQIDVGAALSAQQLAQASETQRQNLMVTILQLQQALASERAGGLRRDQEFAANLGFNYDTLNAQRESDYWDALLNA